MGLTAAQLEHFEREGYVVAEDVLVPTADLQPVIDEYTEILNGMSRQMHAAGEIDSAYDDLPFGERAIAVVRDSGYLNPHPFDINFPPHTDLTDETQFHFGPAVFGLLRNARLLDAVESLIGAEITSNPVQHVRIKVPEHLITAGRRTGLNAKTEWHQDNGVVQPEADETDLLTVWLPLTQASARHGCLQVVPRSHTEGLRVHCPYPQQGSRIPPALIPEDRARPVPMSPGDVLFMHRRCMHSSLTNVSDEIRWSLDIRYHPTGQASGRAFLPGFVARSRANPTSELRDPIAWRQSWLDARDAILAASDRPRPHRWTGDHELCA